MYSGGKIIRINDIAKLHPTDQGLKRVLVGGCFDIFHYGHLHFLTQAKKKGDRLIVLLESDIFIEKAKHKKPVHTQMQRAEMLAALTCVDTVVLLPEMKESDIEYKNIIKQIYPEVIAYSAGDAMRNKKEAIAQEMNAKLVEIDYISSFSSSQLINYAPILRD